MKRDFIQSCATCIDFSLLRATNNDVTKNPLAIFAEIDIFTEIIKLLIYLKGYE